MLETGQKGDPGSRPREAFFVACAERVDRILTWGFDPNEREDLIREREADRRAHLADPDASLSAVAARSVRSALADLVYRLLGGEVSAIPMAAVFVLIGAGAVADTFTSQLPLVLDSFSFVTGIGFLTMAVAGFVHPRRLKGTWLLPGAVMVSIGAIAGAILLPVAPEGGAFDWITKIALAGGGVGFGIIGGSLVSSTPHRRWFQRGGMVVWVSALFLGIGLFGLGVLSTPVYSTRASTLLVAVASVAGAALMSRLRHIPLLSQGTG